MINKDNMFILTKEELKNSGAFKFKEGDYIICGNYFIKIKYGNYPRPSFLTTVSTREDIRDLAMSKHPKYIRDFIEKWSDEELKRCGIV